MMTTLRRPLPLGAGALDLPAAGALLKREAPAAQLVLWLAAPDFLHVASVAETGRRCRVGDYRNVAPLECETLGFQVTKRSRQRGLIDGRPDLLHRSGIQSFVSSAISLKRFSHQPIVVSVARRDRRR